MPTVATKSNNAFSIKANGKERILSARPDTLDFRDKMYVPTLVEVSPTKDLEDYQSIRVPILDQGQEGACTGFGLAAVANYLLRTSKDAPRDAKVSPRMMYEMAKKYDEWPGEEYDGSSARGAMKGWHKHGVCSENSWEYDPNDTHGYLDKNRAEEAREYPLGAYYRVNHRDLVAMHSAISETGILYATSIVHEGWSNVGLDGRIPFKSKKLGGHAFAIVAYDRDGFWIQNSWGNSWGRDGFGHITYDDWLINGSDVWVARLGVPVKLSEYNSISMSRSAVANNFEAYSYSELRPHIVSIGNDGKLSDQGTYGTNEREVEEIFEIYFPTITKKWSKKRLLVYAHGGLTSESSAIQMLADRREILLKNEIFPITIVWKTDFWSTVDNIIKDALRKLKPGGFREAAKEFLFDRIDDSLEPVARIPGKMSWDEMKENALMASNAGGGAKFVADLINKHKGEIDEIHVVGFSAGSIFHAPFVKYLAGSKSLPIASCSLWAPACTMELFKESYMPLITQPKGGIESFYLYTMDDDKEQRDTCKDIYHKSLLYLVSNSFEEHMRIPFSPFKNHQGEPLLGMEKFINDDKEVRELFTKHDHTEWIISPNDPRSNSTSHGGFDDDEKTLESTMQHILKSSKIKQGILPVAFQDTPKSLDRKRVMLAQNLLSDNIFLS